MQQVDIAIIGAGVAGLTAAQRLAAAGRSVAIIEARDRLGGRIFTKHHADFPVPSEYGAEFVHGLPPETFALRGPDFALDEIAGETWTMHAGQPQRVADRAEGRARVMDAIAAWTGDDMTLTAFLAERFGGNAQGDQRADAQTFVEGFDAADSDEVSLQWLALSERASRSIHEDRQFRPVGGYSKLIAQLRRGLESQGVPLHLNTIVDEITWSPGAVRVSTHDPAGNALESISARAAVVTLPLGVLLAPAHEAGAVCFIPDLAEKATAYAGLALGQVMRVVLRFREVFWELATPPYPHLPGMAFLFTQDEGFPSWWTNYPHFAPQLTAWVAGPRAARMVGQSQAAIIDQAVAALARIMGVSTAQIAADLVDGSLHDWGTDPFARGSYSYVRVGGLAAPGLLGAPVADTLFFAGEATNTAGHTGTVHGAIATGHRAAAEVLHLWP